MAMLYICTVELFLYISKFEFRNVNSSGDVMFALLFACVENNTGNIIGIVIIANPIAVSEAPSKRQFFAFAGSS